VYDGRNMVPQSEMPFEGALLYVTKEPCIRYIDGN